jgi:peptidoglycan/xylan/chitin deacetylase (PgdA/CDA1 family)
MSLDKPVFIISLDVEMLWGFNAYPDHPHAVRIRNSVNAREPVDILLRLFEKHKVPATWATVGHLFLERCDRAEGVPHPGMPRFRDNWYNGDPCTDITRDPLYYGKDIVERALSSSVGHEIGYHSFSHVIFSECSREVALAEVGIAGKLGREFGIKIKSFVFPENKIGHIDVLREKGFMIYRGKNITRYSPDQRLPGRKINAAIDRIIAPPVEPSWKEGIWEIESSMFFCDHQIGRSLLPRARLGLDRTIKSNKVFHVWLHPDNLFDYPSLRNDLDRFLKIVSEKRDKGLLEVMTMGTFAQSLRNKKALEGP